MDESKLLNASCRVALAAYLHDLGKFSERARIDVDQEKLAIHRQLYARKNEAGGRTWYTHVHAAYTALAWDLVEKQFPELLGEDVFPFAAWNNTNIDDSIVNAAAMHHKPSSFLQWVVATADRVASGFEREEFEKYNAAEDKSETGRTHYTARLLPLLEQVRLDSKVRAGKAELNHRYPLKALTVDALFPHDAEACEPRDNLAGQEEYSALWSEFVDSLQQIPKAHRDNWSLWLDHFDSAWAAFTHAIPAATAFGVKPEVSLYDHSRTTAAIATALWRYHHDSGHDAEEIRKKLADYSRPDWDEDKLLLIQGDFFGVQDFIFASGGETQRQAARLLRGRSFYVSLLTECAALKVLEALGLPPTSQVINAAGKFLIVAPNTPAVRNQMSNVQAELDGWFLKQTYGESGIGLAVEPACCNDFLKGVEGDEQAPFSRLMQRLFARLEKSKFQRFNLAAATPVGFDAFLDDFTDLGVCAVDGRSPAVEPLEKTDRHVCALAADQVRVGKWLTRFKRVIISSHTLEHQSLSLDIFGYHINFTAEQQGSGKFGGAAADGIIRRFWDLQQPESGNETLFRGYARRYINGYVPVMGDVNDYERDRYQDISGFDESSFHAQEPKTFEHIACDDLWLDISSRWTGETGLTILKGDVDNLGLIFQRGLGQMTFAKQSSLSRQINAFFSVYLPYLCRTKFKNTYTVFAGGDDFFLVGPWRSTMQLAMRMNEEFKRYVAGNPEVHFSTGMVMTKTGMPVRQMAALAEQALEDAKAYNDGAKNAVTAMGYTVSWEDMQQLWKIIDELEAKREELGLSTGYIYGLQELADMAQNVPSRLENALWNSRFNYRTWRMLERKRDMKKEQRRRWQEELGRIIGGGISTYKGAFRIPLSVYLYKNRH